MIIPNQDQGDLSQAISYHCALIEYHLEISNQLPNPPSYKYLSQMPYKELFASLQLSIFMLTNLLLANQQVQYETQLRSYEDKLRSQYRRRCLNKLKIEAMEKKLMSLLYKEDNDKTVQALSAKLAQKENEVLILRAENSNLKAIIAKNEEEREQLRLNGKQQGNVYCHNDNKHKPHLTSTIGNSNSNINININDISNSNVIIKTNDKCNMPVTPIKKHRRECYLSSSQSNKNIYVGYFKPSMTPNKGLNQGNMYQGKSNYNYTPNKPNDKCGYVNPSVNKKYNNNNSNSNQQTVNNTNKHNKNKNANSNKSKISNFILYSSYQNSLNNTLAKGTIQDTQRADTVRDTIRFTQSKK